MGPNDLILEYAYTDRGNSKVYSVKREVLSSGVMHSCEKRYEHIGSLRITEDGAVVDVDWVHTP